MNITIKWTAFQHQAVALAEKGKIGNAEMSFEVPTDKWEVEEDDIRMLDYLFECTNLYQGAIWKLFLDGKMPEERSHTALSVGDQVVLDGRAYSCELGDWKLIKDKASTK